MYAVVRRYTVDADNLDNIRRRIDEDFLGRITKARGFVSYHAFDDGSDLTTVSIFLTQEEAEASVELARQWVSENEGLVPSANEVFGGEVFSHAGQ